MVVINNRILPLFLLASSTAGCLAWTPPSHERRVSFSATNQLSASKFSRNIFLLRSTGDAWSGDVVSNTADGKIIGCSVTPVGDGPLPLEWIVTIDGVEADLGRFSDAIYKKVTADAKRERFQGFRPGTIPPHLEGTYRAFAMDECARETVLEAMQQNNIRPFDDARSDFVLENFRIPPPTRKNKKKKSKKRKKSTSEEVLPVVTEEVESEPEWRTFDDMKGALAGGWRPGQSFSFVARKVKGQQVKSDSDVEGSTALGTNYMNF